MNESLEIYIPTDEALKSIWLNYDSAYVYLLPLRMLQHKATEKLMISLEEINFLIWGVNDGICGNIPRALSSFEIHLLESAPNHGDQWHSCILAWCAQYRLLACDPKTALQHLADAENILFGSKMPEIQLLKGMALRLSGNHFAAVEVLRPLSRKRGLGWSPLDRNHAIAWLIESKVAGGIAKATFQQIRWLENQDKYSFFGTMGVVLAALYRLSDSFDSLDKDMRTPDEILFLLDKTRIFERPMLNMLLQDILPRPLSSLQPVSKVARSRWWEPGPGKPPV